MINILCGFNIKSFHPRKLSIALFSDIFVNIFMSFGSTANTLPSITTPPTQHYEQNMVWLGLDGQWTYLRPGSSGTANMIFTMDK